jgi:hypothetical protein
MKLITELTQDIFLWLYGTLVNHRNYLPVLPKFYPLLNENAVMTVNRIIKCGLFRTDNHLLKLGYKKIIFVAVKNQHMASP